LITWSFFHVNSSHFSLCNDWIKTKQSSRNIFLNCRDVHILTVNYCSYSGVDIPFSILGAEIDRLSPPELVKQFEEILSAKSAVRLIFSFVCGYLPSFDILILSFFGSHASRAHTYFYFFFFSEEAKHTYCWLQEYIISQIVSLILFTFLNTSNSWTYFCRAAKFCENIS